MFLTRFLSLIITRQLLSSPVFWSPTSLAGTPIPPRPQPSQLRPLSVDCEMRNPMEFPRASAIPPTTPETATSLTSRVASATPMIMPVKHMIPSASPKAAPSRAQPCSFCVSRTSHHQSFSLNVLVTIITQPYRNFCFEGLIPK